MSSDVVQEEAECGSAEAGEREERERLVASLRAEDMLPGHEGLKSGVLKNGLRYCFFPQKEACGAFLYTHTVLLLHILLQILLHTHTGTASSPTRSLRGVSTSILRSTRAQQTRYSVCLLY
jgi:hypothetical protein